MPEFKVGDTVKIKYNCSGCLGGHLYKLVEYSAMLWADSGMPANGCSCQDNWELVKPAQPKKIKAYGISDFIDSLNGGKLK
jgi:hypothetical protein